MIPNEASPLPKSMKALLQAKNATEQKLEQLAEQVKALKREAKAWKAYRGRVGNKIEYMAIHNLRNLP